MALQNADKYLEEARSVKDIGGSASGYKLAGQQDIGGASLKEESPLLSEEMKAFRDNFKPFLRRLEPIVDESGTFNNHGRKEESPPLSAQVKAFREEVLKPFLSSMGSRRPLEAIVDDCEPTTPVVTHIMESPTIIED